MLDQLVAFCSENITEADVLNVFGFTSEQVVADFTERILRAATADAVQILHEQCEAGKDMMRLMSDLISYLRDLLVFKVKPDTLDEDIDLDLRKSLVTQAELVETDRLLELIDLLAEAESRMKWAPNKKLHFEVAIIGAIQSLGHATLDEVIEKLGELRDGKTVVAKSVGRTVADPAREESLAGSATVSDSGDSGYSSRDTPRVEESTTTPRASTSRDSFEVVDPKKIWEQLLPKIPARGFLRTLSESVAPIGIEGRNFQLGYPPNQRATIETLASTGNRKQLETLLHEASGRHWTVKFVAQEGIQLPNVKDPKSTEAFKHDPLIQEALEMFKGKIRS
jgi:DNA polymerase-3 subunit gamma/tau